jgi:hypothetical protein
MLEHMIGLKIDAATFAAVADGVYVPLPIRGRVNKPRFGTSIQDGLRLREGDLAT